MKKRIFAVAAALCLMAGTGAFAQEAKPAAAPKERPTVEQMAQRMTERMQKELKLTDAQAKEVYNLNFQQIKEMQAMREKMREARKAEAEARRAEWEALLAEAKELMRQGKVSHQLFCKEDAGLKRRIWYIKNQLNNYRKYKRYFGNKSLVD